MIEASDIPILENILEKVVRRVFGLEDPDADNRLPFNQAEFSRAYKRYAAGDKKALSEYVRTHRPDIEK